MSIRIKKNKINNFTQIDNIIIRDKTITNQELGFFLRLFYLPDNFVIKKSGLETLFNIKKNQYYKLTRSLQDKGYLKIIQENNNGKFAENIWELDDTGTLKQGFSTVYRNSACGNSACEDSDTNNTISNNTIKTTTKEEESKKENIEYKLDENMRQLAIKNNINDLENQFRKFLLFNNKEFKNINMMTLKWHRWIEQAVTHNTQKEEKEHLSKTNVRKHPEELTIDYLNSQLDQDEIFNIYKCKTLEQKQGIGGKINDFILYCLDNNKRYDNYIISFSRYLEIARQRGWNF